MEIKKKKILFNITSQFGYHTDTYMYCKYLDKSNFEVHYTGFDTGLPKYELKDVNVHYIPLHSNKIRRYYIYFQFINKIIRKEKFDLIFQVDHKLTLLIRLYNLRQRFILDIRTGDLSGNKLKRKYMNLYILFTSLFYKKVSIISESLRQLLKIPKRKSFVLPLGGEQNSQIPKKWDSIHMLYIGTLTKRRIEDTIEGLAIFKKRFPDVVISYDIVGNGSKEDIEKLRQTTEQHQLGTCVKYHGQKKHSEIQELWDNCNLGLAYIPIEPYYQCQPTTKLFEYALSGMAIIATNTIENQRIVTSENGLLCNDTPVSIAEVLYGILKMKDRLNSLTIKRSVSDYEWDKLISNNLVYHL